MQAHERRRAVALESFASENAAAPRGAFSKGHVKIIHVCFDTTRVSILCAYRDVDTPLEYLCYRYCNCPVDLREI